LKYEFLDKKKELVKTIEGNFYGIWDLRNNQQIISSRFKHIFQFENRFAVAITMRNNFIGITEFGQEVPLAPATIEEYKNYIVKGSKCNCNGDGCGICNYRGFIINQYGVENNL
jgi:hypothetical protein